MAMNTTVTIEGRQVKLSNLDKVLYPDAGFTKGDVIDYYRHVAGSSCRTWRAVRSCSSDTPTV